MTLQTMGGGYIALFKKLYKIKKQHKKEQKIYQQTIQVFPQLKYPNLETCSDYEQALKYKFHLSYMLGEVLIKAYQTWYKGSGFKLTNDIKKAKKEFQIFREIFKEFDQINSSILKGLIDNKQLFLKEFPRIKHILKIHQDYQPILDNIFHNFNYFIQNFDLIEEWLLSDDFKERYKKENHPYPSLLDPKKLNNENEKINYHNIPAELAWEMNLPLPDGYKFIFMHDPGSGHLAMERFLYECDIKLISYYFRENIKEMHHVIYEQSKTQNALALYGNFWIKGNYFYDALSLKPTLYLTRDPLSRMKAYINHAYPKNDRFIHNISLEDNPLKILDCVCYADNLDTISVVLCKRYIFEKRDVLFRVQKHFIHFLNRTNVYYIDMEEINLENAFNTMKQVAKKFNFSQPNIKNLIVFQTRMTGIFDFILPKTLNILLDNEKIQIIITTKNRTVGNFIDITNKMFDKKLKNKNIVLYITQKHFNKLSKNLKIFNQCQDYLSLFLIELEKKVENEQSKKINEMDILEYLKQDYESRIELKKILDEELIHIKQHRPDIVASWKYYQEFEKMCKELDG
ncbi:DUF2972 domain-containing protein [Campylobacter jejuni]|nr:DUF2972 domain-containing protein [Campylobacter jejuni]